MKEAIKAAYKLLGEKENVVGVEVGVLEGIHALGILNGWKSLKMLHLIDNYIGKRQDYGDAKEANKQAVANLIEYQDRIQWHFTSSEEAVKLFDDNSLDFVYIDGCHEYKFVKQDLKLWLPKVKRGGILGGHDYSYNEIGVVIAVGQFIREHKFELFARSNLEYDWVDWWIYIKE